MTATPNNFLINKYSKVTEKDILSVLHVTHRVRFQSIAFKFELHRHALSGSKLNLHPQMHV